MKEISHLRIEDIHAKCASIVTKMYQILTLLTHVTSTPHTGCAQPSQTPYIPLYAGSSAGMLQCMMEGGTFGSAEVIILSTPVH